MSLSETNDLSPVIEEILKHIPTTWPLQQFVATNPLWDLVDKSIEQVVSQTLLSMTNIQMLLPIATYWGYYNEGRISDVAIHQAIAEHCAQLNRSLFKKSEEDAVVKLYPQLLYNLMTGKSYQKKLITCLKLIKNDPSTCNSILFSAQIASYGYDDALASIQDECLDWLASYVNPTTFQKKMMTYFKQSINDTYDSNHQFFNLWHVMMLHKNKRWKSYLMQYSNHVETFILSLLNELSVPTECIRQYLFAIVWQLKGWCGYSKWQQQYPNNPYVNSQVHVIEIIAIWLAYEVFWLKTHAKQLNGFYLRYQPDCYIAEDNAIHNMLVDCVNHACQQLSTQAIDAETLIKRTDLSVHQLTWLWQRAYEMNYHQPLYQTLLAKKNETHQQRSTIDPTQRRDDLLTPATAQWVFCIDVRSEGFRRHIEQVGNHETFGFAGFFGVAAKLNDKYQHKITCQCPALIEPTLLIEMLNTTSPMLHTSATALVNSIDATRKTLLAPFALYEMLGFWFALVLIIKNYANTVLRRVQQVNTKQLTASRLPQFKLDTLDLDNRVNIAINLLNGIGLTQNFSEFVVICGHTATIKNNPYQASLDCGACGGNSGMSNAIIVCQLLNQPDVRKALEKQSITIPGATVFVAACHDTTTDHINWYVDVANLNPSQQHTFRAICKDAMTAGEHLRYERLRSLPGNQHVLKRSCDWAELLPELGLANNAAFIIAPRRLTQSLNLQRRVFLHSYEEERDVDGSILEAILLGPMIVAHWINSQYYFSAVDPQHYASGNKAIHNVLATIGVIEGNQSDLKYGLPHQSKRIHEPKRLCVFIDASQQKIDAILKRHQLLQSLVNGRWLFIKNLSTKS